MINFDVLVNPVLIVLIVVGVLLWLVTTYVPMSPPIKQVVVSLAVVGVVLWALQKLGLLIALGVWGPVVQTIIVVGVLLWLVTTWVPMAQPIKQILVAVAVIAIALLILQTLGWFHGFGGGAHAGHGRHR